MLGSDAHSKGVFANLPAFSANEIVAQNLVEYGVQVVEKAMDKKRLKPIPR